MLIWLSAIGMETLTPCAVAHLQISKKWKLLSVEKQQQELEAKRKAKQEAKEQAKRATGK